MKKIILLVLMASILSTIAFADLVLDRIQFDPAIIAAGDEVDIVVEFHQEGYMGDDNKLGNSDYQFSVELIPDDTLTKDYIIIADAEGNDLRGSVGLGETYNKRFRVQVQNDAPAGNYEFKLVGQWYKKGIAEQGSQFLRFKMPVKKEGIILGIATIDTQPTEVRSGDNYVKLVTRVENVGEKDAKNVELALEMPKGFEASYTNANRFWIGRVNAGESKEITFFVDVDKKIPSDKYDFGYSMSYMDLDDNTYAKAKQLPFLIKPRPYLEVFQSIGQGLAGSTTNLMIKVKNTGEESAEAVDVRILKQNSQPFTLDIRSDYIGELEPGEEGLAVFDIKINPDAELKEHDLKLLIRSKGDSDEGDDNIYTYNRRAKLAVVGKSPNTLLYAGLVAALIVVILIVANKIVKRRKKK